MSAKYTQEITANLVGIGDYGITTHVPKEDAERAIQVAESFLNTIKNLIGNASEQV